MLTKHAGAMQFAVHVLGRTAHVSRKEEGEHAILRAGEAVATLEAMALPWRLVSLIPAVTGMMAGIRHETGGHRAGADTFGRMRPDPDHVRWPECCNAKLRRTFRIARAPGKEQKP